MTIDTLDTQQMSLLTRKKVVKIIMDYGSIIFGLKHIIEQFEFIENVVISHGLDSGDVERMKPDILMLQDSIAYRYASQLAKWKSNGIVDHIIVLYDKDSELRVDQLWKCQIVSYLPSYSDAKQLLIALEGQLRGFSIIPTHITEYIELRQKSQKSMRLLTQNEQRVLKLVAAGQTNTEIAQAMHLSVRTVETYLNKIYRKLDVRNRAEAVCKYYQVNSL
ncbi:response regulator transcription factor [Paenibacillus barcinonensis]|uniref:response regulator transcription factor n=1 Tax=Paenibacillus barcinonensis TaxID=198119 RepID=UPI001C10A6BA|nr:response regulator transcription factor [Paenibacillus barcinonensis]MBU5355209.1 response regulator transcription factor [Paenibacillus barcinonensis]